MLQHPLLSQRSSWGRTHQEMLLNDLSPVSPKPASPGLAEAIAPGTEGMAKLKIIKGGTQQTQPSHRSPACHRLQLKHSQVIIQSFVGCFFINQSLQAPSLVLCTCCQGCHEGFQLSSPTVLAFAFLGMGSAKIFHFPCIQLLLQNKKHHFGRTAFFPEHPPAPQDTSAGNAAPSALGPRPAHAACPGQGRLRHCSHRGHQLLFLLLLAPSGTKTTKTPSWDPAFSQCLTAAGTNPLPPSRKAIKQRQPPVIIQQCPSKPEQRSSSFISALVTIQRGVNNPGGRKGFKNRHLSGNTEPCRMRTLSRSCCFAFTAHPPWGGTGAAGAGEAEKGPQGVPAVPPVTWRKLAPGGCGGCCWSRAFTASPREQAAAGRKRAARELGSFPRALCSIHCVHSGSQ